MNAGHPVERLELGWLNAKIVVMSRSDAARKAIIPGLAVTGLP